MGPGLSLERPFFSTTFVFKFIDFSFVVGVHTVEA